MPQKAIKPREIAAIREKLNVSQPVFAALLNVPLTTARSWEQGKRKPSGTRASPIGPRSPAPENSPGRLSAKARIASKRMLPGPGEKG